MSKTINDSNINLNKFPASNIRQLAKKMESSKATAKYIKQVASKPQATQVHLMRHQCTELPPNKFQRKEKKYLKSRQATNKYYKEDKQKERMLQVHRRNYNNQQAHASQEKYSSEDKCNKCVTPHMWRDLDVQPVDISVRIATCLVILVACATRRKMFMTRKGPWSTDHPRHTK